MIHIFAILLVFTQTLGTKKICKLWPVGTSMQICLQKTEMEQKSIYPDHFS